MTARVNRLGFGALALVLFAAGCGDPGAAAPGGRSDSPTPELSSVPAPSVVSEVEIPSPRPVELHDAIPLPDALDLMPGRELMWVWTGGSVTAVAPNADEPELVVDLGFEFGGMVEAEGVLWFPEFEANVVHRYDLAQRTWLQDVEVMQHPNRIVAHAGSVWVANGHGRWVVRIDAATGEVVGTWEPLTQTAGGEDAPSNAFWGTSSDASQAFAIDPATGELTAEPPVPFMPCAAQPVDTSVWVTPCIEPGLTPSVHVLTATGDADISRRLPGWLGRISPIGDRVWAPVYQKLRPDDGAPFLLALDSESLEAVDAITIETPVFDALFAFDFLWLTTPTGLVRVERAALTDDPAD